MLGQRADGELLRFAEEGVSPRRRLRHEGRGAGGARRVHRGLLQQPTSSLVAGVRFPSGVRTVRKLLTYCPLFVGNSTIRYRQKASRRRTLSCQRKAKAVGS